MENTAGICLSGCAALLKWFHYCYLFLAGENRMLEVAMRANTALRRPSSLSFPALQVSDPKEMHIIESKFTRTKT